LPLPQDQPGIIDYLWFVVSLTILGLWLRKSNWGRKAFSQAPLRLHNIQAIDVLIVALFYIATFLLSSLALKIPFKNGWDQDNISRIALALGQLLTAAIILVITQRRFEQGLKGLGLSIANVAKTIKPALLYCVVAFGLTFLALAITLIICRRFGYNQLDKHPFLELLSGEQTPFSLVLIIILTTLVAPLVEELLFRGLLQNFIIGTLAHAHQTPQPEGVVDVENKTYIHLSPLYRWAGIIITAAIFAIVHPLQHWPALFVLGICLGYSYERHGNLLIPITMHCLFNVLPITVTLLAPQ
jgi:membrane protease YdiL (CAAX protease family)